MSTERLRWWRDGEVPVLVDARTTRPPPTHRHALSLEIDVLHPDPVGLPGPAEHLLLATAVNEALAALVEELDADPSVWTLGGGRVVALVYLERPIGWREVVDRALSPCPRHVRRATVTEDPERVGWAEHAPPPEVWQHVALWGELQKRWDRGDRVERERAVSFTIAFPTAEGRAEGVRACVRAGFALESLDDGAEPLAWTADVARISALSALPEALAGLEALVEPHGGQVDDWGAPDVLVGGDPPEERSEELRELLERVAELGRWHRAITHRAAFPTAEDRDAFAGRVEALGFERVSAGGPPQGVRPVGLAFELVFSRADGGGWLAFLVPELAEVAARHGGRYLDFEAEPLFGESDVEPEADARAETPDGGERESVGAFKREGPPEAPRGAVAPSPIAAFVFSVVAPGAGHLHAARPREALLAFLATLAWVLAARLLLLAPPLAKVGDALLDLTWGVHLLVAAHAAWSCPRGPVTGAVMGLSLWLAAFGVGGSTLALRLALRDLVAQVVTVTGDDMSPTLRPGDEVVLLGRWSRGALAVGDLVALRGALGRPILLRVLGVPEERVILDADGRVTRDGAPLAIGPADPACVPPGSSGWREGAALASWTARRSSPPVLIQLPESTVWSGFVLVAADDRRTGGAVVPVDQLIGRVRPPERRCP